MKTVLPVLKGRGTFINPGSRYEKLDRGPQVTDPEGDTHYIPVRSKSLINTIDSPDVGHDFSINPYQGCEHGCIYCYARNTHPYWGYSAGLDFERRIMVKMDAPRLLEEQLQKPSWKARPIVLSGNTDCYQPAERKYRLTRQMLEVCLRYRHPISIITKNSLIERDLDLLVELARHDLVHVAISMTTRMQALQRILEPRTASPDKKLQIIQKLSHAGVPVMLMAAPIIPAINDQEIISLARGAAEAGATTFQHMVVRLNGDLPTLFEDWLNRHFPDRKSKVLNGIRSLHGGKLGNTVFKKRMRGDGNLAALYAQQAALARRKFNLQRPMPPLNTELHAFFKSNQLDLFAPAR